MAVKASQYKEKKGESSNVQFVTNGKPVPIKIAYIGGGSRGWAHALMTDLLLCPYFTGEVRLYDINRPMAELNAKFGNWLQSHPGAVSHWKYRVVPSLKTALKGVDFVFLSIQPGPIQAMKIDLEEPMKYGIFQPVGDTVGPGGCIRALRALRDYKIFGAAIAEHAPQAWTVNFTNPMTICTRGLYEAFPGIKAYGCCHEVFGTQGMLGDVYSRMTGQPCPVRKDIKVNVLGINHFTWINRAVCYGSDLLTILKEYLTRPGVIRTYTRMEVQAKKSWFTDHHQVKYELFQRFGVLASAGDRHLAEFVPWFLKSPDLCFRWGFCMTPYSYRFERYRQAPKQFRRALKLGKFPELSGSGEEYINQMLAITGKGAFRTNVNLPNRGQMRNVPLGAVVETNAIFSENTVEPVVSGALPDNVNILVLRHILNQEALVKAVFTENKDLAFQAFLNDPLMHLSVDKAWKLFNTMLRKTHFTFNSGRRLA